MPNRICFISPKVYGYFNPEYGHTGSGAERQVYLLSKALATCFDVHVIVGDYGQSRSEKYDQVTIHRAYPLRSRKNRIQPINHFIMLGQVMRRIDADVYLHRGGPKKAVATYLLARMLNKKWIYHVANDSYVDRRPEQLSALFRLLFKRALYNGDAVVAQTNYQYKRLVEQYRSSAVIIPNGYPESSLRPEYDERDIFLWVGRLDKDQNQPHLFLDIAEKNQHLDFQMIGPPSGNKKYARNIKTRANSLENVDYLTQVPPDEIHDYYQRAIALVNTSAYEGFPNTFLEAWRVGTPVVSLTVDTGRYLDGQSLGYCHGEVSQLISTVKNLSESEEEWHSIADISYRYFMKNLTIDAISEQYKAVLTSVINGM